MAHAIFYTCDVCEQTIKDEPYGVLFVNVVGQHESDHNANLELCSLDCLARWAKQGKPSLVNEGPLKR